MINKKFSRLRRSNIGRKSNIKRRIKTRKIIQYGGMDWGDVKSALNKKYGTSKGSRKLADLKEAAERLGKGKLTELMRYLLHCEDTDSQFFVALGLAQKGPRGLTGLLMKLVNEKYDRLLAYLRRELKISAIIL